MSRIPQHWLVREKKRKACMHWLVGEIKEDLHALISKKKRRTCMVSSSSLPGSHTVRLSPLFA
jgi:hypothetical protein